MFYIIATLEKRTYISIYTNSINNIVNNRYENDIDKRKNIFRGRKVGAGGHTSKPRKKQQH